MSDTIQTDIKHEGTLTQAFNLYGDPDRAPRKAPGQQQDVASASALSDQDHDDSAVSAVHDRQRKFDKETIELSRHDDPSALAGRMSIIGVNLRSFMAELKKKKDSFMTTVMQLSLNEAIDNALEFGKWIDEQADKFNAKAGETLDLIGKFDEEFPAAREAFAAQDFKRTPNGKLENDSLQTMLMVALTIDGIDPKTFDYSSLIDEEMINLVGGVLDDPREARTKLNDRYEMEQKMAQILRENGKEHIQTEIEEIMNIDNLSEEQKKKRIGDIFDKEKLERKIVQDLRDAGVSDDLIQEALNELDDTKQDDVYVAEQSADLDNFLDGPGL